tara:strand:- start:5410 stop:6090 length:681 start_codon:yes stop_codon:yes gene_type:complete
MRKNIKEYIVEKSRKARKNYTFYGNIPVYVKDPLPDNVNIIRVMEKIEKLVPKSLVRDLEMVVVGHLKDFEERQINALYKDNTIYVTSAQSSNEDMIDDIVHEMAHCVEEYYTNIVYDDMSLENEFIEKRKKLYYTLAERDFDIPPKYFLDPEYDEDFDMFLYTVIGYPVLLTLSYDLFTSPYAITSLREYFAKGFEEYFLGSQKNLKEISPVLYNKIRETIEYAA